MAPEWPTSHCCGWGDTGGILYKSYVLIMGVDNGKPALAALP